MSSPNLLSLPREIRSIIYSHLSESLTFDWGWRALSFPTGGHEALRLSVPAAPLINVLLSCRQIYHEYSQERQFRKSVLVVHLFGAPFTVPEGKATNDERVKQLLQRVHKLHFVVQLTPHSTTQSRPSAVWGRSKVLIKKIEGIAPQLESMGMVVHPQNYYVARDMRTGAVVSRGLPLSVFTAELRAEIQQDFGDDANAGSRHAACRGTSGEHEGMVGEWNLQRAKDGLNGASAVK